LEGIPFVDKPPVDDAEVVETGHPHRDLLDQMRILFAPSSTHERDLVVDGFRIGAQEDDAGPPVLLGDPHAHDVAVEGDHPLEVAHVDADVSESHHPRHGFLPYGYMGRDSDGPRGYPKSGARTFADRGWPPSLEVARGGVTRVGASPTPASRAASDPATWGVCVASMRGAPAGRRRAGRARSGLRARTATPDC